MATNGRQAKPSRPYAHQRLARSGDQKGFRVEGTDGLARIKAITPPPKKPAALAILMNVEPAAARIFNRDTPNIMLHNDFPA